jgi:hypothetical protein
MGTNTTRLLLWKPDGSPGGDNINVDTDISDNADIIDDAVGFKVCTSGTRPTGAQRWNGRVIYETDTKRTYMWQATLGFWMPLIIGQGSGVGPYLLGTSTDSGGEGINISASVANAHILRSRVTTEANPRLTLDTDGRIQWGAGGASAVDTNLYRNAANELKTDDAFSVVGNLTVTGTAAWNKLDVQTPTGATCTFSSINQNYQHLMIVGSGRGTTVATFTMMSMQVNGNATAIYDMHQVAGSAATVAGAENISVTSASLGEMSAASATAGACSTYQVMIPNYKGTSFWKSWQVCHTLSSGTGSGTLHNKIWAGRIRATAAITSIVLLAAAGNFATGSTFTLYGLL